MKKTYEEEKKVWYALYLEYNDDNVKHADQAFCSRGFDTEEEIHADNVSWIREIFSRIAETKENVEELKRRIPDGAKYYAEYYESRREKCRKCKYYWPSFHGDKCVYGAKTLGEYSKYERSIKPEECNECTKYKSRYIEYPLVINGIEYGDVSPWDVKPCLAIVRPCNDENTYLGLYLGEMPRMPYSMFNEESGTLKFGMTCNPCLYVPKLSKVVWGDESWWSRIESEEEFRKITDEDINRQFYVQMLKELSERGVENGQEKNEDPGQKA